MGENIFCMAMDEYVRLIKSSPLQSVRSMALSAMAVDYKYLSNLFTSLLINRLSNLVSQLVSYAQM